MSDINYENLLKDLLRLEETLQFKNFTNEMALEIGLSIVKKAKELNVKGFRRNTRRKILSQYR